MTNSNLTKKEVLLANEWLEVLAEKQKALSDHLKTCGHWEQVKIGTTQSREPQFPDDDIYQCTFCKETWRR